MKKFTVLIKRIIISAFLIYSYNLIAINLNIIIPINFWSLGLVSIFGTSALVALILFRILVL